MRPGGGDAGGAAAELAKDGDDARAVRSRIRSRALACPSPPAVEAAAVRAALATLARRDRHASARGDGSRRSAVRAERVASTRRRGVSPRAIDGPASLSALRQPMDRAADSTQSRGAKVPSAEFEQTEHASAVAEVDVKPVDA
jgi:hypothetical protein